MKKLNKVLAGVLVSSMIFGICSCASDKTSKSDSDDNETVASEVEEDDTAADETTEDETEVTETVNEHYAENVEKFLEAIKEADLILLSMGSLYTSIIPNLLADEMKEALKKSNAKKMYICNIIFCTLSFYLLSKSYYVDFSFLCKLDTKLFFLSGYNLFTTLK